MNATRSSLDRAGVATVVGVALLIGLGVWQLQRLAWKEALIAAVETRAHARAGRRAAANPNGRGSIPADYEYRRVRLSGVFDVSRQALVFRALSRAARALRRPRLSGDDAAQARRAARPCSSIAASCREERKAAAGDGLGGGETTVAGLMRASETRNWFTPVRRSGSRPMVHPRRRGDRARRGTGPHAPFFDRRRRRRRSDRAAGRRRDDPRLPQQPSFLCDDLVRHGGGAGRRLRRLCGVAAAARPGRGGKLWARRPRRSSIESAGPKTVEAAKSLRSARNSIRAAGIPALRPLGERLLTSDNRNATN